MGVAVHCCQGVSHDWAHGICVEMLHFVQHDKGLHGIARDMLRESGALFSMTRGCMGLHYHIEAYASAWRC